MWCCGIFFCFRLTGACRVALQWQTASLLKKSLLNHSSCPPGCNRLLQQQNNNKTTHAHRNLYRACDLVASSTCEASPGFAPKHLTKKQNIAERSRQWRLFGLKSFSALHAILYCSLLSRMLLIIGRRPGSCSRGWHTAAGLCDLDTGKQNPAVGGVAH